MRLAAISVAVTNEERNHKPGTMSAAATVPFPGVGQSIGLKMCKPVNGTGARESLHCNKWRGTFKETHCRDMAEFLHGLVSTLSGDIQRSQDIC